MFMQRTLLATSLICMLPALVQAQTGLDRIPRSDAIRFNSFGDNFGLNARTLGRAVPRDLSPFRTSFDSRFPNFGNSLPPAVFRNAGHDIFDFDGTVESIDRDLDGIPDINDPVIDFSGNNGFDPFANLTPADIRARGEFFRDQGQGVGARAFGVGTGSGNQFAGMGAFNYGTSAGLGLFYSGVGDYYAGQGQYLRGQGDYEYSHSVAAINHEQAEYEDLRNDDFATKTFFSKRRTNMEARRQEADMRRYAYGNRPSAEELAKLQKLRAPDPLGPRQHDPLIGLLNWPVVLQHPAFDYHRERISDLYARRSEMGQRAGLGSDNYQEIRETAAELQTQLKENMDGLTPMEYVVAKNYLNSVVHESRSPVDLVSPVAEFRPAAYRK